MLEGRVVQDIWIFRSREEGHPGWLIDEWGTTIRFYDQSLDIWRISWHGPVNHVVRVLTARPVGNEIWVEGPNPNGQSLRWMFSQITSHSFHWSNFVSEDGVVNQNKVRKGPDGKNASASESLQEGETSNTSDHLSRVWEPDADGESIAYAPFNEVIAKWREIDQCGSARSVTRSGAPVTTWMCQGGSAVSILLIPGGVHTWPGTLLGVLVGVLSSGPQSYGPEVSINASQEIADFFAAHQRVQ